MWLIGTTGLACSCLQTVPAPVAHVHHVAASGNGRILRITRIFIAGKSLSQRLASPVLFWEKEVIGIRCVAAKQLKLSVEKVHLCMLFLSVLNSQLKNASD